MCYSNNIQIFVSLILLTAVKLTYIPTFLFLLFTLASCQKKSEYIVYFFQNVDDYSHYQLLLDENNLGEVPYLDEDANPDDELVQSNSLILILDEGTYKYQLLTHGDELIASGKFKIKEGKVSSSGRKGSAMLQVSGYKAALRMGE